jgi:hypothetical protein
MPLSMLGLLCILGAIVGGGLKASGINFPLIQSTKRQAILAAFGVVLFGIGNGMSVHTVSQCSDWTKTTWQPTVHPDLHLAVDHNETIVSGYVETDPSRTYGTVNVSSVAITPDRRAAVANCAAQDNARSSGYCRIHAIVDAGWSAWGNCR